MRYVVTTVGSWMVTHDAAGKVVIRKSGTKSAEPPVIAVAQWQGDISNNRLQTKATEPGDTDWVQIDKAIRIALKAAESMGPDPRLDPGELPPNLVNFKDGVEVETPKEPLTAADRSKAIGFVVAVLIVIAGLIFFWPEVSGFLFHRDRGDANGAQCKYDRDCRSGVCDYGQCKATKRVRGDRCDFNSQCNSGDCSRGLCN